MAERLGIVYDPDLIEQVASDFDLRKPNKIALKKLVQRIGPLSARRRAMSWPPMKRRRGTRTAPLPWRSP